MPQVPRKLLYVPITCGVSSDSSQRLEAFEDVCHLSGSGVNHPYPRPRLLYDGLGYFVALIGTFLRWVVGPRPTVLRPVANLANVVLYRKADHTIQASEYIFFPSS